MPTKYKKGRLSGDGLLGACYLASLFVNMLIWIGFTLILRSSGKAQPASRARISGKTLHIAMYNPPQRAAPALPKLASSSTHKPKAHHGAPSSTHGNAEGPDAQIQGAEAATTDTGAGDGKGLSISQGGHGSAGGEAGSHNAGTRVASAASGRVSGAQSTRGLSGDHTIGGSRDGTDRSSSNVSSATRQSSSNQQRKNAGPGALSAGATVGQQSFRLSQAAGGARRGHDRGVGSSASQNDGTGSSLVEAADEMGAGAAGELSDDTGSGDSSAATRFAAARRGSLTIGGTRRSLAAMAAGSLSERLPGTNEISEGDATGLDDPSADKQQGLVPPAGSTPALAPKNFNAPRLAKMWNVPQNGKLVLPKRLDLALPALMDVAPGIKPLTPEQIAELRKLLHQQNLQHLNGLTRDQLKKLLEARKDAERPTTDANATDPEFDLSDRPPPAPRTDPPRRWKSANGDETAALPEGLRNPFTYRPWDPAWRERYAMLAKASAGAQENVPSTGTAPSTDPKIQTNTQVAVIPPAAAGSTFGKSDAPTDAAKSAVTGAAAIGGTTPPSTSSGGNTPPTTIGGSGTAAGNTAARSAAGASTAAGTITGGTPAPGTEVAATPIAGTAGTGATNAGTSATGTPAAGAAAAGSPENNGKGVIGAGSAGTRAADSASSNAGTGSAQAGAVQSSPAASGSSGSNGAATGGAPPSAGSPGTGTPAAGSVSATPTGTSGTATTEAGILGTGAGQSGSGTNGAAGGSPQTGTAATNPGVGGTQGALLGAGQPGAATVGTNTGAPGTEQPGVSSGAAAGQRGAGILGTGQTGIGQPIAIPSGGGVLGTGTGQPSTAAPTAGQAAGVLGAGTGQPAAATSGAGQSGGGQQGIGVLGTGSAGAQAATGHPGAGVLGAGQTGAGVLGAGQPGAGNPAVGPVGAGVLGTGQAGAGQAGAGQVGNTAAGTAGSAAGGTGVLGSGQPAAGAPNGGQRDAGAAPTPGDVNTAGVEPGSGADGGMDGAGFVDSEGVADTDNASNELGNSTETGFTPAEGVQPSMPPHNHDLQKGIPGALVLPPLPPLGSESGKGLAPHPLRPMPRVAVQAPRPALPSPPAIQPRTRVLYPVVRAAAGVEPERPRPVFRAPVPAPPMLTVGSTSTQGTVAVQATDGPSLPVGSVSDSVNGLGAADATAYPTPAERNPYPPAITQKPAGRLSPQVKPIQGVLPKPSAQEVNGTQSIEKPARKTHITVQPLGKKQPANSQGIKEGSLNPLPPTPLPDSDSEIGDGSGLKGEYYLGRNFDQYQFTRADSNLDFIWATEAAPSPSPKLPQGSDYSVRWTGKIEPRYTETYTLFAVADDGVRVWINHKLLVDDWTLHPMMEYSGKIHMEVGKQYDIRVDYFESNGGGAGVGVYWESPSQKKEFIPEDRLFYPLAGDKANLALDEKPHD